MLVAKKPSAKIAVNLSMPIPAMNAFDDLAAPLPVKGKWMLHTAALLLLLECSAAERESYLREIVGYETMGGDFAVLVEMAKAGQLREDLRRRREASRNITGGQDAANAKAFADAQAIIQEAKKPPAPPAAQPKKKLPKPPRAGTGN